MDGSELAIRFLETVVKAFGPQIAASLSASYDNASEWWKRRNSRAKETIVEAAQMVIDSGRTSQPPEDKFFQNWLDGASLEDNGEMRKMFAALLANASLAGGEKALPGFIAILRQMSPLEARALNWMYEMIPEHLRITRPKHAVGLDRFKNTLTIEYREGVLDGPEAGPESLVIALQGLESYCLVSKINHHQLVYVMTVRGYAFIEACQPPKKAT